MPGPSGADVSCLEQVNELLRALENCTVLVVEGSVQIKDMYETVKLEVECWNGDREEGEAEGDAEGGA